MSDFLYFAGVWIVLIMTPVYAYILILKARRQHVLSNFPSHRRTK